MKKITLIAGLFIIAISTVNATTSTTTTTIRTREINGYAHAAGSGDHMLEIRNGQLWAWGNNSNGQIGDGFANPGGAYDRFSPKLVSAQTDWAQVNAGFHTSFAIKSNGTLWA